METIDETSAGGIVYKQLTTNSKQPVTLWLITQHSQHKGWVFPKGLIADKESKESKEDAAIREVQEEGGIKARIVNPTPIVVKYTYQWYGSPHAKGAKQKYLVDKTVFYYLMKYESGDPKDHDWEMMDAKFATEEEVKKLLSYPSDKEAFKKACTLFKSLQ
ncbi:MAG: NUDIX domain-containing protein [Patescibacteria group bacterium]